MKSLLIYSLIALSLITLSCSRDTVVTPEEEASKNSGTLNFTINKTTAPAEVASVKLVLSRSGQTDILGTMDLTSSTSASLTLKDILEGTWHVKVDALNAQNEIIYTGEADVIVKSNEIVYLNLTLNPVNGNLGIINITVNWGTTPQMKWVDYGVVLHGGSVYQLNGAFQQKVIYEDGMYKMWYSGINNSNVSYIFYTTSKDGIQWTNTSLPVLYPSYGKWDSYSIGHPRVVKVDSIYYMYYRGEADTYGNWHIGLATSKDGINWIKKSEPVIRGTIGNRYQYVVNEVLYMNNKFYLYLSSSNDFRTASSEICLATSTDGINFDTPKPILPVTKVWESGGIYQVSIISDNGKLKMIYNNFPSCDKLGYAESSDGINWIKNDEPIFTVAEIKDNWVWNTTSISYVKVNNDIRIYYAGVIQNRYYYKIGFLKYIQ